MTMQQLTCNNQHIADLPTGWTAVERDIAAVQIFVPCNGDDFVDPHIATGGAAQEFTEAAAAIVASIQFAG